jgi:hypothetical protein
VREFSKTVNLGFQSAIAASIFTLLVAAPNKCSSDQSTPGAIPESLAEAANDPTAALTQLQFKDSYTPSEYGTDAKPNTLLLRTILAVRPHGPLDLEQIIRPTFQLVTIPEGKGASTRTEFGDTQIFDLFVMPWPYSHESEIRWGLGPYLVLPTASSRSAGQGAWQLGPAFAFRYRPVPSLLLGALIQQATSVAYTSPNRAPVTSLTVQPMITYSLNDGWYIGCNEATWTFNLRHETSTTIPLSVGFGKIWKFENDLALNASLSGEWMIYRQFAPDEEQFTLKFQVTLLLQNWKGDHSKR